METPYNPWRENQLHWWSLHHLWSWQPVPSPWLCCAHVLPPASFLAFTMFSDSTNIALSLWFHFVLGERFSLVFTMFPHSTSIALSTRIHFALMGRLLLLFVGILRTCLWMGVHLPTQMGISWLFRNKDVSLPSPHLSRMVEAMSFKPNKHWFLRMEMPLSRFLVAYGVFPN